MPRRHRRGAAGDRLVEYVRIPPPVHCRIATPVRPLCGGAIEALQRLRGAQHGTAPSVSAVPRLAWPDTKETTWSSTVSTPLAFRALSSRPARCSRNAVRWQNGPSSSGPRLNQEPRRVRVDVRQLPRPSSRPATCPGAAHRPGCPCGRPVFQIPTQNRGIADGRVFDMILTGRRQANDRASAPR